MGAIFIAVQRSRPSSVSFFEGLSVYVIPPRDAWLKLQTWLLSSWWSKDALSLYSVSLSLLVVLLELVLYLVLFLSVPNLSTQLTVVLTATIVVSL